MTEQQAQQMIDLLRNIYQSLNEISEELGEIRQATVNTEAWVERAETHLANIKSETEGININTM